jgi:hypothetical protein
VIQKITPFKGALVEEYFIGYILVKGVKEAQFSREQLLKKVFYWLIVKNPSTRSTLTKTLAIYLCVL